MNIVLMSGLYPPSGGGAERVTAMLAQGLARLGHRVTVITVHGQVAMDAADGVGVLTVPDRRAYPYTELSQHGFLSRFAWHLADLLDTDQPRRAALLAKQEKADVVITGNSKGLGVFLPSAIRSAGLRHIHIVHDVQPVEPSGLLAAGPDAPPFRRGLRRLPWIMLMRRVWQSPAAVIFPSQWLKGLCEQQGLFPQSARVVVRNPVEQSTPASHPAIPPSPNLRLLFVGQVEPHKGIAELIAAIRALPDQDIRLDVVGDGSLRMQLERGQADARIHFDGRLYGERLADRYAAADALIVPSRVAENAPLVVLEAFMRRMPVIATPVGGVPELVIPGETGWLAWPDSPAFADALAAVRQEKERPTLRWSALPDVPTPETYARAVLAALGPA